MKLRHNFGVRHKMLVTSGVGTVTAVRCACAARGMHLMFFKKGAACPSESLFLAMNHKEAKLSLGHAAIHY